MPTSAEGAERIADQGTPPNPQVRWRPSWITVFYLLPFALLLLLSNLAGRPMPELLNDGKYGPHFEGDGELAQGWPLKCVRREWVEVGQPPKLRLSFWRVWQGIVAIDARALFINAAIAVTLLGVVGALLEFVRGRRNQLRGLRVGLSDLLIITTIVAIFCGIFAWQRRQYQREPALLEKLESVRAGNTWIDWHTGICDPNGRPEDLLQLCFFDSVRSLDVSGDDLQHAVQFPNVTVLRVQGASNSQLAQLQQMKSLVALDMFMAAPAQEGDGSDEDASIRLPYLPNLKGLNLFEAEFCGDGLENVPALERLDASRTQIDDGDVEAICKLKRLRRLSVWGTMISDEGIARLRAALPECQIDEP
jgi:heme exporter protein D